jgi:hypothetical protein
MNRVLLSLTVFSLGAMTVPCRADWIVQQPGPALPPPRPTNNAPPLAPGFAPPAPHFAPPATHFAAPAPEYPAAPAYVEGGCCWSSPCESSCHRPGLFARIRERLQSRHCEPCECHRPGLIERIRMRRAERRAGWCNPCCE